MFMGWFVNFWLCFLRNFIVICVFDVIIYGLEFNYSSISFLCFFVSFVNIIFGGCLVGNDVKYLMMGYVGGFGGSFNFFLVFLLILIFIIIVIIIVIRI